MIKQEGLIDATLDSFVDAMIYWAAPRYTPTKFIRMRRESGKVAAKYRLVTSGEIQTAFRALERIGMIDRTT